MAHPDPAAPPSLATDPDAAVRALLAKGDTKQAVERAKEHHKRLPTDASQALLVEAYVARIGSLSERGLAAEAKALTDVVWERFPSARASLADLRAGTSARVGRVDDLLRPLADPALPAEKRAAIEETLRTQVSDPAAIAECEVLPPDHPLRLAAAAVSQALSRVTQGPVDDEQLALPEVSRKGPLAPWKVLVRAIAALHRRDDAACEAFLSALEPGSAPARLVPAIRAVLAGKGPAGLRHAAADLVTQVAGDPADLRQALAALDRSVEAEKRGKVLRAIGRAVDACARTRPDLLGRLRQEISVRALLADIPAGAVRDAMGGPALRTSHFWRLRARAEEMLGNPLMASVLWEEFLVTAVDEGWFEADSLEAAAVRLHQAEIVLRIPTDDLDSLKEEFLGEFRGFDQEYEGQPRHIVDTAMGLKRGRDFLSPARLLEQAAALDPCAETFQRWWNLVSEDAKAADEVAFAWRRALPKDPRPLLLLVESAEERDALKKALGYLEEAEALDALDPRVRKARLRLLVASTLRHMKQEKPHLVEKDLAEIESLPQTQEGRRAAFVSAARAVLAARAKRELDEANWRHEAALRMGSEPAAFLLVWTIADLCGSSGPTRTSAPGEPAERLAEATARVCMLGDDLGLRVQIPPAWEGALRVAAKAKEAPLDAASLLALCEAALRADRRELAYDLSGAGIARRGSTTARFLWARARSLPYMRRRLRVAAAAASLARDQRDMGLASEAAAEASLVAKPFAFGPGEVEEVIAEELTSGAYPTSLDASDDVERCDCPACQARRRGGDDEEDDEEDDVLPLLEKALPPELNALLIEMAMKYSRIGGEMPDPSEIMEKDPEFRARFERILETYGLGGMPPFPFPGKRGRR